ncbi:MAG: trigger factor [Pseudomonadota bacterium]
MQVTETSADGLKREYKVVLSAADIEEKVQARLEQLKDEVKLPGFRPGKVPESLLRKRYGQAVMGEVLEKAVNDSSQQAITERNLRPAMQPQIEITSYDEGQDLEYSIKLEVMPEIEPADFTKISLERLKVDIPDNEIDEALQRLAEQQKKTEPLSEERPAQSGDVLVIDFKGSVNGESLPGMEAEDHHLELGSNAFVGDFEDQLIGKNKGDEAEVKVTFPEAYGNEKLAGQEAVFQVKVKDILNAKPAEIDDELAKSYGAEDLEDLKSKLREHLGGEYQSLSRTLVKRQLLDELADRHDFEVPDGLVEMEFEAIWNRLQQDKEAGNLDPEDAEKDEETLKSEYRAIAERRVRLGLLLSEVGRLNEIDVAQEELQQALIQEAQRYPGREQEVFEHYQKNPQSVANLRGPLLEEKVVDHILDQADVAERSVTPDELREEFDSQDSPEKTEKAKATKSKSDSSSGKKGATSGTAKKAASTKSKSTKKDESEDEGEAATTTKKSTSTSKKSTTAKSTASKAGTGASKASSSKASSSKSTASKASSSKSSSSKKTSSESA